MSYASITVAEGLTMADYRAVGEQLGPHPAEGLVSEAAGLAEGRLYVITVWDSKAQYERFVTERLIPAFGAAGVRPGPTTVTDVDVDVDTLYTRTNETANH
jgi:hypothetical protein